MSEDVKVDASQRPFYRPTKDVIDLIHRLLDEVGDCPKVDVVLYDESNPENCGRLPILTEFVRGNRWDILGRTCEVIAADMDVQPAKPMLRFEPCAA